MKCGWFCIVTWLAVRVENNYKTFVGNFHFEGETEKNAVLIFNSYIIYIYMDFWEHGVQDGDVWMLRWCTDFHPL